MKKLVKRKFCKIEDRVKKMINLLVLKMYDAYPEFDMGHAIESRKVIRQYI